MKVGEKRRATVLETVAVEQTGQPTRHRLLVRCDQGVTWTVDWRPDRPVPALGTAGVLTMRTKVPAFEVEP